MTLVTGLEGYVEGGQAYLSLIADGEIATTARAGSLEQCALQHARPSATPSNESGGLDQWLD